ncbi:MULTISPECIES: helix-turn-helix domain-containing protein [unclassified Phenylobacterium]|uniref:helix-turn-helix domain-containing protein n=1 Tax=unclassified Phenylobacterium TaxID=2640670 RepID=UPI003F4FBBB6
MSRLLNPRRFNAEKFAWQHQVLADVELSAFSKVLGAFLTHYLDPEKGGSWASQQFLATHLGVDVRTIRRATSELVAHGHIALEVSRGRGNANVCRALLKGLESIEAIAPEPVTTLPRVSRRVKAAEHRTAPSGDRSQNRANGARKPDTAARPILSEPESPLVPPTGPVAAWHRQRRQSSDVRHRPHRQHSQVPWAAECTTFPNTEVRAAVVRAMGEGGARSYLDPATWSEADRTIVCQLGIASDALRSRAGKELGTLGVAIIRSPGSGALSRAAPSAAS